MFREGVVTTDNFTAVTGQAPPTYPFEQSCWSFALGTELYLATFGEISQAPLSVGVTLLFGKDIPAQSRSMPQKMTTQVRIVIRMPLSFIQTQESLSQQVALLIDQAFYQVGGKLEIQDYEQFPSVPVADGGCISWAAEPRGTWEFTSTAGEPIEEMVMDMEVNYPQPEEEWQ